MVIFTINLEVMSDVRTEKNETFRNDFRGYRNVTLD